MCPYRRKMCFIALILIMILLLTSCYRFESEQGMEYNTFHQEMQEKDDFIYSFLPSLEDDECIDDIYLFYSDRDLIDSYYTVYLNCKYSMEEYQNEKNRIAALFVDQDLLVKNSDSFNYESLMYSDILVTDAFGVGITSYTYVLFDESDFRIIYVTFFDKELNGNYSKIPEEYLPKKLVKNTGNTSVERQGTVLCLD